jgi:two-component system OmpR family response regulator
MSVNGVRVLVVEDDSVVRDAIGIAFRGEGFDVLAESNGTAIAELLEKFQPDLAILDVRLPVGPDGYAMASTVRDSGGVPVLMLTAADRVEDRLRGFQAGADDYVGKPFAMAELVARGQALLRRAGRNTESTTTLGDLVVDNKTRSVTHAGQAIDLTRTEFDLLAVLLRHQGQILSKQQLLVHIWGFDAFDPNVVEVHVSALRRKLEAHGPRVIDTVRSVGYIVR